MPPSTPPRDVGTTAAIEALTAKIAAVGSEQQAPTVLVPDDQASARARDIVLRQLAVGPRSRATLGQKLRSKDIPDHLASIVLDRFEQLGLIDDRAYAQGYVRAKHRDRALGRRALRVELQRKGIDQAHIEEAIADIDGDAEEQRATELVAKRLDSALAAGPEAARRRLLGLLARRGYSASLATQVVEDAIAAHGQSS